MAQYRHVRLYKGTLKAAILDWSGTTADKYVLAPAVVFYDVFQKHKVPISMEEARAPMGLRKDLHIKVLCNPCIIYIYFFPIFPKNPMKLRKIKSDEGGVGTPE